MSEAAAASVAAPARDRSFLLRRLHSLSGIVPIGAFLVFHLFENLKVGLSPQAYEASIRHLWEMLPRGFFYAVEAGLLGVPILFHALYGFWIWYTGESNTGAYPYRRNWLYTAQRWSGLLALAYMALHVWQLRVFPDGQLMLARGDADLTTFAQVARAVTPAGWTALYLVGGFAAAFHLGNGLFGFAYSWGLAVSRRAQRNVEAAGWGLTAALCVAIAYTVYRIHFPAVP
jgi:succinate dehydrogenase / fumarate reductase cytochrome b subunit